jgi:tRNA(fMet)-specific endonuclease VapC
MVAAEIYADLRKRGQPIADIDILIAGIAQANGLVLITHNLNDFSRVTGLAVEDWSQ